MATEVIDEGRAGKGAFVIRLFGSGDSGHDGLGLWRVGGLKAVRGERRFYARPSLNPLSLRLLEPGESECWAARSIAKGSQETATMTRLHLRVGSRLLFRASGSRGLLFLWFSSPRTRRELVRLEGTSDTASRDEIRHKRICDV